MKTWIKSLADLLERNGFSVPTVIAPWILGVLVCLLITGCATRLPQNYERTASTAFARPEATELGRFFQAELIAHPGKSGVALVPTGEWGFRARSGLATMAEKTLDVQYYLWEIDTTGIILAERLIRAADRGVRIRMLMDDINTANSDFQFARMDHHPNIEIRLFNPFINREARLFELVFGLSRLNHRMHNKAFIADNAFAIVGGRNIGDNYFGVHTVANFRDLDVAVVGPVVQDVSRSFDEYWNSKWAIPVRALIKDGLSAEAFRAEKAGLYRRVENIQGFPYPIYDSRELLFARLEELRENFIWATATALYDPPDKLETGEGEVIERLRRETEDRELEIIFESAYFIAGKAGVEAARLNTDRGVRIRMLTNSLATNDVAAAHAGYARYREDLIRNGMELYELRPDADSVRKNGSLLASTSKASLHTKAIVIDKENVFIGSFNLDPRSISLNTEIVIRVESPEFAARVKEYMDVGTRPENSYRLILEPDPETGDERLVWVTEIDGKEVRYYSDPEVGMWRQIGAWFMSLLPIEKHL